MANVERESDAITIYLNEIGRVPLLKQEEEVELLTRKQVGFEAENKLTLGNGHLSADEKTVLQQQVEAGREARISLVNANQRLVVSLARKYLGHGLPLPDLIQAGNLGLLKAVKRFDVHLINERSGRPYRFTTFATYWVRRDIIMAARDEGRNIRLPSHIYEQLAKIRKFQTEFEAEFGRAPNLEEIAAGVELTPKKVEEVLPYEFPILSLDKPVGEEGESLLVDFIPDNEMFLPIDKAEYEQLSRLVDDLLGTLTPRQRKIIELRYGIGSGNNLTLEEVGDELGITRERVRQIQKEILNKLRHPSKARKLEPHLNR